MEMLKINMAKLQETSLLDAGSSAYLEQLYDDYIKNPAEVPEEWQSFFKQLNTASALQDQTSHLDIQQEFKRLARQPRVSQNVVQSLVGSPEDLKAVLIHEQKQIQVGEFIEAYRLLGHLQADIDPLKIHEKLVVAELMPSYYRLTGSDLNLSFDANTLPGKKQRPLREIIEDLNKIYCGSIAAEFMHIPDTPERIWVQSQFESLSHIPLSLETKRRLLSNITQAEGLEKYIGSKFPGAKRFSLEGTDTLIVALDTIIQQGGANGAKEIAMGMAHRGRLNVLVNLLGKTPNQLFDEFEGHHYGEALESGDVKYHQGFSSNVITPGGTVHLSLAFNPSHLEIVTPVVCGSVKARQERRHDTDYSQVICIGIHGDAAFAGQGVVMETLNMAETRGFHIGGTIHIITNNQIGFTTSNVKDARSTLYCSDIGKMMEVPIFHVNADDPEAVYRVMELVLKYRTKFNKDVIINLLGYRREGHNEADEPAATQPLMYQLIRKLPTVLTVYSQKLINESSISKEEVDKMMQDYRDSLDKRQQSVVRDLSNNALRDFSSDWKPFVVKDWRVPTQTGVSIDRLKALALKQCQLPEGFVLHPRVQKIIEDRRKMSTGEIALDWGFAETLAYATLLKEGYLVRLSGQDVGRGTFFHRHVVLHNQIDDQEYTPLCHLDDKQATFMVVNSLLSEEAVLAFEYGFSNTEPLSLVIWEAQFGDFANGAQVVIDQFISSGEQKWGRLSGLTLLLPHGFEGQGAEHSSARLERYLQLSAQHNIQVCVPTTPAQFFHMIRRQMVRPMRKPLIALTPKSLLRHKLAVSSLTELEKGSFAPILLEIDPISADQVKKIIFCSGKVYYELLEERRKTNRSDVAIIRIEQIYPFPDIELKTVLAQYPNAEDIVWCQEEPKNQGAWYTVQRYLIASLVDKQSLRYAGRQESAAPAVGYLHLHQEQQSSLVKDALS